MIAFVPVLVIEHVTEAFFIALGIAQSDNLFCTHRSNKQKGDVYDVVRKNQKIRGGL